MKGSLMFQQAPGSTSASSLTGRDTDEEGGTEARPKNYGGQGIVNRPILTKSARQDHGKTGSSRENRRIVSLGSDTLHSASPSILRSPLEPVCLALRLAPLFIGIGRQVSS